VAIGGALDVYFDAAALRRQPEVMRRPILIESHGGLDLARGRHLLSDRSRRRRSDAHRDDDAAHHGCVVHTIPPGGREATVPAIVHRLARHDYEETHGGHSASAGTGAIPSSAATRRTRPSRRAMLAADVVTRRSSVHRGSGA